MVPRVSVLGQAQPQVIGKTPLVWGSSAAGWGGRGRGGDWAGLRQLVGEQAFQKLQDLWSLGSDLAIHHLRCIALIKASAEPRSGTFRDPWEREEGLQPRWQ